MKNDSKMARTMGKNIETVVLRTVKYREKPSLHFHKLESPIQRKSQAVMDNIHTSTKR